MSETDAVRQNAVVAAVIGLGSMGIGMARSMKRAGLDVVGYDISPTAIDHFIADGGRGAATPANAAKNADIVVSVVVNSAQTEAVLFGPHGVAETMKSKAVFISSATMDPAVARIFHNVSRLSAFTISMHRFRAERQRRRAAN